MKLGQIKKGSRLHKFADALRVRLEWLGTGRGDRYPGNQGSAVVKEQDTANAWHAYLAAPPVTQATVDLLLLPKWECNALSADRPELVAAIALLEAHAMEAMHARKTA